MYSTLKLYKGDTEADMCICMYIYSMYACMHVVFVCISSIYGTSKHESILWSCMMLLKHTQGTTHAVCSVYAHMHLTSLVPQVL